jgi:sensor histidine kinase YesM
MFDLDKVYTVWNWNRISRHLVYWGFWLLFYCILNGSQFGKNYVDWLLFELETMPVKLPVVYFVAYFLLPKFIPNKAYLKFSIGMVFTAIVGSALIAVIFIYFPYGLRKNLTMTMGRFIYQIVDLLYIVSFVVAIKLVQEYARQKRENTILAEEKVKSELQMLKNQLQPHFLFNNLNNIYSLVISNDSQAGGAILQLSDILSYMLYECYAEKVAIDKEIQLIKNYIELEKVRYGQRLDLSMTVEGDHFSKGISPLLLIPFVENAFKHGVAKTAEKSWIRIHLDVSEHELSLMVENNYPTIEKEGMPMLKSGIGIENLKKRLDILYPNHHAMSIHENGTYLVNLKIQL